MGYFFKQIKDITNPKRTSQVYFSPKQFKAIKSQIDFRDEVIKDLSKENYNLKEENRSLKVENKRLLKLSSENSICNSIDTTKSINNSFINLSEDVVTKK